MTVAWIAVAVVAALWAWSRFRTDPAVLADRAAVTGRVDPVLAALHRVSSSAAPTEYHRVIKRLWDGYHREVAVPLAKDFAARHRDAPTAQYWIRRFLEDEPEIARAHLDEAFLGAYFDPAVAAKCGSYG